MSQYIEGVDVNDYSTLTKQVNRQFVAPRFRRKFRGIKASEDTHGRWLQQTVIKGLCKKLTDQQFDILQKQNANYIEGQLSRFKSKLRKSLNETKTVSTFFDKKTEKATLNLKQIFQKMPEKLQLGKKYNNKMVISVQVAKQAHQISSGKRKYYSWLDRQNNSPLKSPNYQKMNFVFQKLQLQKSIFPSAKKQNLFMKDMNHQYKPIQRRVQTLGNQHLVRISK